MHRRLVIAMALVVTTAACTDDGPSATSGPPTTATLAPSLTAGPPTDAPATTAQAPPTSVPAVTVRPPEATPTTVYVPPVEVDPQFVLRYATPGPVNMRSNPFAPAANGAFPDVFAAHLYRVLPPSLTLIPELAADDEPPPAVFDGTAWVATVDLNPGLTWSDGDPIDAFDIQFTYEDLIQYGDPADLGWAVDDPNGMADLLSVTAAADYRVEFRFAARPGIDRWHYGIATAAILPEHYWGYTFYTLAAGHEQDGHLGLDAPSAGGYRFGSVATDDRWIWEAVNGWWNSAAQYTVYDNGAVRYRNLRFGIDETYGGPASDQVLTSWVEGPYAGEVVWFDAGDFGYVAAVNDGRADLAVGGRPIGVIDIPPTGAVARLPDDRLRSLVLDPAHPALATVALRSAIPCFVDLPFLTNNVLQGSAQPSGWTPAEASTWPGVAGHDPCPFDGTTRIEEGLRRMTEAGWTWEVPPTIAANSRVVPGAGLVHIDGLDTALTVLSPGPQIDEQGATAALWIEGWLEQVGFDVEVVTGLVDDAAAPPWDVAVAVTRRLFPPIPHLAGGAGFEMVHLDSNTVAEAQQIWTEVVTDLAVEVLAMPLFRSLKMELSSPEVTLPYLRGIGGIDGALVATSVQQAP